MKIAVIHGPNLRLLGKREPEVYGHDNLDDVNTALAALAREMAAEIEVFSPTMRGSFSIILRMQLDEWMDF